MAEREPKPCTQCRHTKPLADFGRKKSGEPWKTCLKCQTIDRKSKQATSTAHRHNTPIARPGTKRKRSQNEQPEASSSRLKTELDTSGLPQSGTAAVVTNYKDSAVPPIPLPATKLQPVLLPPLLTKRPLAAFAWSTGSYSSQSIRDSICDVAERPQPPPPLRTHARLLELLAKHHPMEVPHTNRDLAATDVCEAQRILQRFEDQIEELASEFYPEAASYTNLKPSLTRDSTLKGISSAFGRLSVSTKGSSTRSVLSLWRYSAPIPAPFGNALDKDLTIARHGQNSSDSTTEAGRLTREEALRLLGPFFRTGRALRAEMFKTAADGDDDRLQLVLATREVDVNNINDQSQTVLDVALQTANFTTTSLLLSQTGWQEATLVRTLSLAVQKNMGRTWLALLLRKQTVLLSPLADDGVGANNDLGSELSTLRNTALNRLADLVRRDNRVEYDWSALGICQVLARCFDNLEECERLVLRPYAKEDEEQKAEQTFCCIWEVAMLQAAILGRHETARGMAGAYGEYITDGRTDKK